MGSGGIKLGQVGYFLSSFHRNTVNGGISLPLQSEEFLKSFDFIRDLAVEEPGDSPFISAR